MLSKFGLSRLAEMAGSLVGASRDKFGDGEFEAGVSRLLAENNLKRARMVGDLFKFTDETRAMFKGMGMPLEWEQGAVFVSDIKDSDYSDDDDADNEVRRSYPLMMGKTLDGGFEIKSLQNLGRPDDLVHMDKIASRTTAHRFRQLLSMRHEIVAKQSNYLFMPAQGIEPAAEAT